MHEVSGAINWWGLGSAYREAPALGWYILTFAIFVAGLISFIRKPLSLYLEARSMDIRKAIEEAKKAKEAADLQLREYEKRLLKLDDEIVQMRADFKTQGEIEKARLKESAEKMALLIAKETEETLLTEMRQAAAALQKQAVEEIVGLARQRLESKMTEEMDLTFRESFRQEISEVKH